MYVNIDIRQQSGEVLSIRIPESIAIKAKALIDDPFRYFIIDQGTTLIGTESLVQTRARSEGIENAVALMALAYEGKQTRRQPISVKNMECGRYLILDGNSTVVIARLAGWTNVPCRILPA